MEQSYYLLKKKEDKSKNIYDNPLKWLLMPKKESTEVKQVEAKIS